MAEGLFAPGHLGELTRIVPFELVDAVPAECGTVQQRLRKLPARVVVYLLLAAALCENCGYREVWRRLTGALTELPLVTVTATALWHARCRLGVRPLRALFDLLRGPACTVRTAGARWRGLLAVAIDGTYLDVPDDEVVRARLGKGADQYTAASGYPPVMLVAPVACGTRAIIDAFFGPHQPGESVPGRRLARSLHSGMIVPLDRGLSTTPFLATVAGTGAAFLARLSAGRRPPVLATYPDGSFLSRIGDLRVRTVACEITITTSAGRRTGRYRPATTLLDHHIHPAAELVRLYHERWEVESACCELKKTMLDRRVLRSRTWPGIAQEVYGLLTAYQVIRIAIADAAQVSGTDPDRCSFSIALNTARDRIVQAQGVIADTDIDLIGTIGRAVLDALMSPRRLRRSPRAVKRPLSRYAYKSLRVDRRTYRATLSVNVLTAALGP